SGHYSVDCQHRVFPRDWSVDFSREVPDLRPDRTVRCMERRFPELAQNLDAADVLLFGRGAYDLRDGLLFLETPQPAAGARKSRRGPGGGVSAWRCRNR